MSSLKNKLYYLIEGQIPEYLRNSYPKFVDFLVAYYQFLEENHEVNNILLNSKKNSDIDLTMDLFVEQYKKQYGYDFPDSSLIERRRLIKFLNQYYDVKGSENAAELFFRMMYNDDITIQYPGDYVLRPSDNVWRTKFTIKVDTDYDQISASANALRPYPISTDLFSLENNTITLRFKILENGKLVDRSYTFGCVNAARISTNIQYTEDGRPIALYALELDIPRTISTRTINALMMARAYKNVVWVTAEDAAGTQKTYGFLSQQLVDYTINTGGEDFKLRDTFLIERTEDSEYPIPAEVYNTGIMRVKALKKIDVEEYFAQNYTLGKNYTVADTEGVIRSLSFLSTGHRYDIKDTYFAEDYNLEGTYTIFNTFSTILENPREVGSDALVTLTVGYIHQHPGAWVSSASFPSDVNKLQDNYYYQAYSYNIQTKNTPFVRWKDIYERNAHPAGFKVFGELLTEMTFSLYPVQIMSDIELINITEDETFKPISDEVSGAIYAVDFFMPFPAYTSGDQQTFGMVKVIEDAVLVEDSVNSV